jgi:hypothetical protein
MVIFEKFILPRACLVLLLLTLFDFLFSVFLSACLSVAYFHQALNFKEMKRRGKLLKRQRRKMEMRLEQSKPTVVVGFDR